MRFNTIRNNNTNFINDLSKTNSTLQKHSFPKLFFSPNHSQITKIKKLKVHSLSKKKSKPYNIFSPDTLRLKSKIKKNINFVKMLNFEEEISEILYNDTEIEKQKEKLDKNNKIKLLRLGLYKKKENNINLDFTEKNEKENIAEKEKENEEDLDRITNENREKEKKLEKKFKEKLTNLEKVKSECVKINQEINKINQKVGEEQMDYKILIDYAEEFDMKYQKALNENNNNDNNDLDKPIKENNEGSESNRKKNKQFEQLNKLIIYKQQREDKKKFLKKCINEQENLKKELENDLNKKREKCNQYKKEVYNFRKNLINSYHLKLYEGIDYRNDGLISIIKDIWTLGINVDINFMPTYLDDLGIQFLLQRAKNSIEIAKLRKVINENENEYTSYLKEWKVNDMELNNILNKRSTLGFFNKNDEHKNTISEKELFKTKVNDISLSYLDPYPKTKEFMIDYQKKHPNLFQNDLPEFDARHLKFEKLNIPLKVMEKIKKIEKLKYLLGMKNVQNKKNDKKEVERLHKEFTKNDYKEKYKVSVESLFAALFGDKKNEMLIYYSKLEKEYKEDTKIIAFHTKYKLNLK